jgi:hypothetical protein
LRNKTLVCLPAVRLCLYTLPGCFPTLPLWTGSLLVIFSDLPSSCWVDAVPPYHQLQLYGRGSRRTIPSLGTGKTHCLPSIPRTPYASRWRRGCGGDGMHRHYPGFRGGLCPSAAFTGA